MSEALYQKLGVAVNRLALDLLTRQEGERIPSISEYQQKFQFSRGTIQNALAFLKESAAVEDLLALMGAQHTIFEVINSRIEREIRNNENRATNCVAKNIEKTISAATRHMEAINKLMEHGKLENLPEGVKSTAMLRYRNPDATLDELARMHEPIISKSGLNHRLQKILEAADDI